MFSLAGVTILVVVMGVYHSLLIVGTLSTSAHMCSAWVECVSA